MRQLGGLSQDTCLAVLAAAAAGVRQLAESDEWDDVGSQAAQRMPQPHALAAWQDGDPEEFSWALRNWSSRRGKQRSPAFGGPGGSQWQLLVGRRGVVLFPSHAAIHCFCCVACACPKTPPSAPCACAAQVWPRGSPGAAAQAVEYLAVYLVSADSEAGRGPPRPARFRLQVVNQVRGAGRQAEELATRGGDGDAMRQHTVRGR